MSENSLRRDNFLLWGVRNLPWTRALGYPRGMTRLGRTEDAPFKGRREKLKRIGGPQGAPWDVLLKGRPELSYKENLLQIDVLRLLRKRAHTKELAHSFPKHHFFLQKFQFFQNNPPPGPVLRHR